MSSVLETRAEVLIIGAGVIGASTALALARAGHDVLVLERNSGVGDGSTGSSAGIIRVHASDPQSSAMARDSIAAWSDWRTFLDATDAEHLANFVRCGSLILDAGTAFVPQIEKAMQEVDVPFEKWDLDQMRGHFPYFDFHRFGPPRPIEDEAFWAESTEMLPGGVYTPESGYVSDPTLAAANLMDAAKRAGARLRASSTVEQLNVHADRVVGATLANGTRLHADVVVAIAGPNTAALVSGVGGTADFRVQTRRIREELIHVAAPPELQLATKGVHFVDGDLNINFRPEQPHSFLGGSNGDLPNEQHTISDADDFDRDVTREVWERTTLRLARRIPSLGIPRARTGVVGLYDAADDWIPIYDRTCLEGLFVAMGTSGTQFKTAPIVGEMLRHIIESEVAGRDHNSVPFASPFSNRRYSTRQFSRLREPHLGQARG